MKDIVRWKVKMMKNNKVELQEMLSLFEEYVDVSDIISSKCMSELSSSIAKKRLDLGFSQKQFAEFVHVSQAMVSKWEGGDYNFTIKALAELADHLDMDLHISLKECKEEVEIKYSENHKFEYTSFQKYDYRASRSEIISFTEMKTKINERKYRKDRLEM